MKIDIVQQFGAVTRAVENRVHDGCPARVVVASRTYDTTVEDLWDALTSRERIPRWFLPISGELRLGGQYQFEGNAGGTIERCDAPNSFGATWEFGGDVSWIEVRLAATADGGTIFTLEHTGSVGDEKWAEYGPGAVGVGWDGMVLGLAQHFSGGALVPAEAMAWMMSDEGRQFMTLSSLRWQDANIAAGTDPDVAKAAAERTTAAYTAVPT